MRLMQRVFELLFLFLWNWYHQPLFWEEKIGKRNIKICRVDHYTSLKFYRKHLSLIRLWLQKYLEIPLHSFLHHINYFLSVSFGHDSFEKKSKHLHLTYLINLPIVKILSETNYFFVFCYFFCCSFLCFVSEFHPK